MDLNASEKQPYTISDASVQNQVITRESIAIPTPITNQQIIYESSVSWTRHELNNTTSGNYNIPQVDVFDDFELHPLHNATLTDAVSAFLIYC